MTGQDRRRRPLLRAAFALALFAFPAMAQPNQAPPRRGNAATAPTARGETWVATWAASAHGPYPSGNPSAQPDQGFAFPQPAEGARDQTFRMMVRPDLWGRSMRFRFTNAFGARPLVIDGAHVGLQAMGGNVARGTTRPITFNNGARSLTVPPGATAWSDPVTLSWVRGPADPLLEGRRLAVSFHTPGPTGPMTWHAKSLTTSYVTPPGAGARGAEENDANFPYATASWFFLDMVDVRAPAGTVVVAAFGDSITDGTNTTMNGDDRWPDTLSRRLRERYGRRVVVVNAGIGGNRVQSPAEYSLENPVPGGPSALARLERDVLQLSGLRTVIWMEGINDFGHVQAAPEQVIAGYQEGLRRMRERGLRVVGATLTSALGFNGGHGTPEVDQNRKAVNAWLRAPGNFDAVADFDAATRDPTTGELLPPFVFNSTVGGPGDKLHPNRVGLMAMASVVPIEQLGIEEEQPPAPAAAPPRRRRPAEAAAAGGGGATRTP